MRSAGEIAFRVRQELGNLWLFLRKPAVASEVRAPLARLPEPCAVAERLRGTRFAREVEALAEKILAHRFPVLAFEIETGPEIAWRRDHVHGIESGTSYFRFAPYLNFRCAGDHKIIWELNRHQHLVLLAQAFRLTGREGFFDEIAAELESWRRQNPFLRGINWASALEAAFRALSWTWIYHLAGERMDASFRRWFLAELYRHGCYLERNLSIYFSPNTHLLGEAVALHALGVLFPSFPRAALWREAGGRVVREQMRSQVREDGSHFEQSAYYHVYALDMFLFHAVLAGAPPEFREKLGRMAKYLAALMGPSRALPFFGDDDGGRFFHPYGPREHFGRATLATCSLLLGRPDLARDPEDLHEQAAWWLGATEAAPAPRAAMVESIRFPDSGMAVMSAGDLHAAVDAGPFGEGSAGHSHSDTLSIVVRRGEEEILIDPGTGTYVSDAGRRNWFRGSAAHNTIRVDGLDQAKPAGPFRWDRKPKVETLEWAASPERDFLDAVCRYRGFTHRRRVLLLKPDLILVLDEIEGPPGEHLVEQFWHPGAGTVRCSCRCFRAGGRAYLSLAAAGGEIEWGEGGEHGWRSRAFGTIEAAPVICVRRRGALPVRLAAAVDCSGAARCPALEVVENGAELLLKMHGLTARFAAAGTPSLEVRADRG